MKYNNCKTCGKQMTPWTTDAMLGRLKNLDCGGECFECVFKVDDYEEPEYVGTIYDPWSVDNYA